MTINPSEFFDALKTILVDELFIDLAADEITDAMTIGSDLGLDSIGEFELRVAIEEKYGITLEEEPPITSSSTVRELIDYIVGFAASLETETA